jgi:hypothetical protein
MGQRQPGMQWNEPALRAAADERGYQHQGRDCMLGGMGADDVKGIATGRTGQAAEGEQQRHRAAGRHEQVEMASPPALGVGMARNNQRPRAERHQLPEEQEAVGVVGDQHEIHRRGEDREQRLDALSEPGATIEAQAIDRGGEHAAVDDKAEERRQRVEPQAQTDRRKADRQARRQGFVAQQNLKVDRAQHDRRRDADRIDCDQSNAAQGCQDGNHCQSTARRVDSKHRLPWPFPLELVTTVFLCLIVFSLP